MTGNSTLQRLKRDFDVAPRLIPYFGAKAFTLLYPAPQHETLIEPFAGGASYALRYPERKVVLVERWQLLAELWRYLINVSPYEIRRLPIVSDVADLGPVPQEAKWLVGWWLDTTTYKPAKRASVRWKDAQLPARQRQNTPRWYWGTERRALIARLVERIKHWKIIEGDYTCAPNVEATWFVDPPYQVKGTTYVHGSKDIDFAKLGAWCQSRPGQVIVCENSGADWLPFRRLGKTTVRRPAKGQIQRNSEVVWMK